MNSGKPANRLADYVAHIEQATIDALGFTAGLSREQFLADKRTQGAVVMSLVVIGEAATRVMDQYAEFAQQQHQVPWRSMRGMRNRIAHGYFDIDLEVVWETVQTALPELLQQLEPVRQQTQDAADKAPDSEDG